MADFTLQSGNLSYEAQLLASHTTGAFSFGLRFGSPTGSSFSGALLQQALTGDTYVSYAADTTFQYTIAGNPYSGKAALYYQTQAPEGWSKIQELTGYDYSGIDPQFGKSVAVDGEKVAVGAPNATISGISGVGGVFLFDRYNGNGTGGATGGLWGQTARLTGEGNTGAKFGSSLDMDLNSYLLIGEPGAESGSGAAYVFNASENSFIQRRPTISGLARNGFGGNVALLSGGGIMGAAVSAYENGSGTVHILQGTAGSGGGWGAVQKIEAPTPESGDFFGAALSAQSNTLIIGSPCYNVAQQHGRVYVYGYNSSTNKWDLSQEVFPANVGANDKFGKSVALDGNYLSVASNSLSGSIYLYQKTTTWELVNHLSGSGIGISGSLGGNGSGARSLAMWGDNLIAGTSNDSGLYYFSTGRNPGTAETRFSFSGESGKFFDNDGNYVGSYLSGASLSISGNVFTGYHNYFINGTLTNANCSRAAGSINSYYVSGTGVLNSFAIEINGTGA